MMPTMEQVTDYFHSVEEYVITVANRAAPDAPNLREAVNRVWDDLSRFGPPAITEIKNKLPVLGDFELPLPPPRPPPPVPQFWYTKTWKWTMKHKWVIYGASAVGIGLPLVGYAHVKAKRVNRMKMASNGERRCIIVVLGGNHPLALSLILDLEKQGYIVLASVESANEAAELEAKCHGYVKALPLNPMDPNSIPQFLRALTSTMGRRFPINVAGDPHAAPTTQAYIHSIISLLTLPTVNAAAPLTIQPPIPSPLEHISVSNSYLPYLQSTHLTPLQILQSLLPILRSSPGRARDKATRSIIVCLPATDARVGLAFSGARAMSAAATLKATEVLRREVAVAALSEHGEGMKNIRVVTLDVGAVGNRGNSASHDMFWSGEESMVDWTPSEKATYGSAFTSLSLEEGRNTMERRPAPIQNFVRAVVNIVDSDARVSVANVLGLRLWGLRSLFIPDRVSVGSGARTYKFASKLPSFILDALLNLPHVLISIRNRLLTIQPHVMPRSLPSLTARSNPGQRRVAAPPDSEQSLSDDEAETPSVQRREQILSDVETGSEADIESGAENDSGVERVDNPTKAVENSWVQLNNPNPWR